MRKIDPFERLLLENDGEEDFRRLQLGNIDALDGLRSEEALFRERSRASAKSLWVPQSSPLTHASS